MTTYPIDLLIEDDGVTVTCPDIPELITCGTDIDDALLNAKDALIAALQFYDVPPVPSKIKDGQWSVTKEGIMTKRKNAIFRILATYRAERGLILYDMAQELNMRSCDLSAIETERKEPTQEFFIKVKAAYGIDLQKITSKDK